MRVPSSCPACMANANPGPTLRPRIKTGGPPYGSPPVCGVQSGATRRAALHSVAIGQLLGGRAKLAAVEHLDRLARQTPRIGGAAIGGVELNHFMAIERGGER